MLTSATAIMEEFSGFSSVPSRIVPTSRRDTAGEAVRVAISVAVYPAAMPKGSPPAELGALLAEPNPAVIATLNRDGAPNTVATWYLWEDGRVLVNMDSGRARLANLRRDPRVSLTVLAGESWYLHVSLRGRMVELADDAGLADIDRLSLHYTGPPYPHRDNGRVNAWIEVESWHAWNDGAPLDVRQLSI